MSVVDLLPKLRRVIERKWTLKCASCGRSTREGKPYCSDHVLEHDYAQQVAKGWAEVERQRVTGRGPELRRDLIVLLMEGKKSTARLRREAAAEKVEPELRAMKREGLVKQTRLSRGYGWELRQPGQ